MERRLCAESSGPTLGSLVAIVTMALGTSVEPVFAQAPSEEASRLDRIVVAPGARYRAGAAHRYLFGSGYRDLWATPIEVPVANLSALGGGVTPNRLGGGMTTRTLHLDGNDGRRYVFRSVDKRPVEFENFEGSALADIIQDQVSSFHPTGAPVVAHLLDAVGVLHTEPTFMVVPDDPRLEEFREEFAGLLVLAEERPDDGPDGSAGFAGSTRIVDTDELFDELEEHPDHRVADEELLRARLVDLLVGDRDRSHNNHLWARFESEGGVVWRVIPRDRDQAFVRFDGLLKGIARRYERRLVTFGEAYPDIFGLTRNAWDIDRRLLVGLDRAHWDRIVQEVQRALPDSVIGNAVRTMPPEHVRIIGDELTAALIHRRDLLGEAAEVLYGVVFSVPDIQGTDAAELLRISRRPGAVAVSLSLAGGPADAQPTYRRVFSEDETSEIRVYLQGGDDVVVLEGAGAEGILVRVVGGGGRDTFRDESSSPQPRNVLYDGGDGTEFPTDGAARVRTVSPSRPYSWFDLDRDLDWGSLTVPQPTASYDGDRGFVLVAGLQRDRYGFMRRPYADRLQLQAGWAFGLEEPIFGVRYIAREALAGADLRAQLRWSGVEIINYFGLGNETTTTSPTSFHRVPHKRVSATIAASVGDGTRRYLDLGPTFVHTSTDTSTVTTLIGQSDPYGAGQFSYAGVVAAFGVDTRDYVGTPTRGYRVEGGAAFYPQMLDAVDEFAEAHLETGAYVSPPGGNPVLAARVAGRRVWGTYPFSEAAFLGGPASVRSLGEQRFAGDGMLLGSAELRVRIGRVVFPIPSDIGVFALADAGRVFLDGEGSSTWHTAVGGGLWFALVNRSNLVRLALARGGGRTALNAGVGFAL